MTRENFEIITRANMIRETAMTESYLLNDYKNLHDTSDYNGGNISINDNKSSNDTRDGNEGKISVK